MFVLLEQCVIFAIWPNHTSSFLSRSSLSGYSCVFLNTLFHSQGLHQNIWSLLQHPLTIGRLVPFYKDRYNFYREVFSAFVYNAPTSDMIDKQWLHRSVTRTICVTYDIIVYTGTEARIYQWLDLVWLGSFQSVTFVWILIRTNIRIYSCKENDTNEYPNIFVWTFLTRTNIRIYSY